MPSVLVIDDDRAVLHMVRRGMEPGGFEVRTASTGAEGLAEIAKHKPDVVLLDIMLPEVSGLDIFRQIHKEDRRIPVIFITAGESSDVAIEAMQLGAFDYVAKPLDLPQLQALLEKAVETRRLMNIPVAVETDDTNCADREPFIGRSSRMLEVFKAIGRVASQDITILIRGESGTGKELVARAIYQHSRRAGEPFVAVNCAAIPDTLLESELFGHEKGSFTGADRRRIGRFEQCNGGTIFLDEIGDMSPLLQGKVLRLLQEQRFERVGGNETIATDVRIITATNRNLEAMVKAGEFRSDLMFRLNGVTINLPPLRERGDDLSLLLECFLAIAQRELANVEVEGVSPEALGLLQKYHWPGNVRELLSVVRYAVLNASGPVIVPAFLPEHIRDGQKNTAAGSSADGYASVGQEPSCDLRGFVESRLSAGSSDLYSESLAVMERYVIARVLQATGGNQSKASEILGITRGKIRDRISTYGITLDKTISVEPASGPGPQGE